MQRCHVNAHKAFEETVEVCVKEHEAAVKKRQLELASKWEEVDTRWSDLEKFRSAVGVKPAKEEDSLVRLNVGGSPTTIWRSVLAASRVSVLGGLFEGVWDDRLPRDAAGRIVVDESPECFKYIIRNLLGEAPQTVGESRNANTFSVSSCSTPENESYLSSVIHMLGWQPSIARGSFILSPSDYVSFIELLRAWCHPQPLQGLELLYRASRDGFNSAAFHTRCNSSSRTISLVRVASGEGSKESFVGGFSDAAWAPSGPGGCAYSTGAFIFEFLDGRVSSETGKKWGIRTNRDYAIRRDPSRGPCFGNADFEVHFNGVSGGILKAGFKVGFNLLSYGAFADERSHHLNGKSIVEVEVFRLTDTSEWSPKASATDDNMSSWQGATAFGTEEDDTRIFGTGIASAFMLERAALKGVYAELARAEARVEAAARALKTVYGPDVAAGTKDPVVELSVRGTSITTLQSTLLPCPNSALAAHFNMDRWPPNDKEMDASGKRTVDCDPTSLGKILDVLRLRKRAAWASGARETAMSAQCGDFHVVVKESDRAGFDELVNMYFPGCESFITDLVKTPAAEGIAA